MSRRKTSREFIQSLNARGFSDAAIGRSVGRSADFIRLVRRGEREGGTIRDSLKTASVRAPRRAGKALPAVAAPPSRGGRKKERYETPSGTLYRGAHPGNALYERLLKAVTDGRKVTLRARWEVATPFDSPSGKRKPRGPQKNKTISVYGKQPIDAEEVLNDLDEFDYFSDPDAALAALTVARNPEWEEVQGLEEYQLLIEGEGEGW